MTERTRPVELYVGESWGGDSGAWYIITEDVPADLPEDQACEVAIDAAYSHLSKNNNVAFVGVYSFWTDDMVRECFGDEEEE